jgi:hypothetical protein
MQGLQLLGGQRLKPIIFDHGAGLDSPAQQDLRGTRI